MRCGACQAAKTRVTLDRPLNSRQKTAARTSDWAEEVGFKTADTQNLQDSCDWADRMRRVQLLLPLTYQVKHDVSFVSVCILHFFGAAF